MLECFSEAGDEELLLSFLKMCTLHSSALLADEAKSSERSNETCFLSHPEISNFRM
jgi:hypothetical protein